MPLTSRPAPSANDALIAGLQRWRGVLLGAAVVLALVVTAGFALERYTTRWNVRTAISLRLLNSAQRSAWESEAAVRRVLLVPDSADTFRPRIAAEQQATLAALDSLAPLLTNNAGQLEHVRVLRAAYARWDSVYATPAAAGEPASRPLALAGTTAFDEVMAELDALVAAENDLRRARFARQTVALWIAYLLFALALAAGAIAALKLNRALESAARDAADDQHRIEEQAAELEQQTTVLEDQALQLEEQAKTLQQRVAERDETNRLLRQATTFLDSALESAPFGIAFYDRALRFQRINEALAAINGAPAEAHLGRRIDEMIPDLSPTIRPILERVLETGEAATDVIVEGVTPADPRNQHRWMVTYYPIRRAGEQAVGVGCMVLDVTEQHRLEQQLRQAQKLEAVGRLAGGIAHDFNNVLTVIQSYAEVLAFEMEDAQPGQHSVELEAIRGAADRAAALARQLLAFSRRDVVIPRNVDVHGVIRGMELILRRLVPASVELSLDLDALPLIVRMDMGQLEQVVMNLAINAVDAMGSGGKLRIATMRVPAAVPDGPERMLLRVQDTGSGMDRATLDRLFEPFFTTKPAGRGTGLGLATTYAIVKDAGGEIAVDSVVGSGTRFDVFLPLTEAKEGESARRPSPARGIIAAGRGSEVVLLAEDEPSIRTAIARILRAHGYRVMEAEHGGEALRLAEAESGPIHLLLTDVMMPGVGGKELVERLKRFRPDTRVIFMSGYTDDAALRAELGTAKFTFLQKPFAARQIVMAVREALDAG